MEGQGDLSALIMSRPGIEPTTLDQKSNSQTIAPPKHRVTGQRPSEADRGRGEGMLHLGSKDLSVCAVSLAVHETHMSLF